MADPKDINIEQVTSYLNHAFSDATTHFNESAYKDPDTKQATRLYRYQVDFSHLINEIQNGPMYIVPMRIQECNDLIKQAENEPAEEGERVEFV